LDTYDDGDDEYEMDVYNEEEEIMNDDEYDYNEEDNKN